MTSSIFSRNNETIRTLTHFLAKNCGKLTIEDKFDTVVLPLCFYTLPVLLNSLYCLTKEL